MTVKVSKPAINVREELADLRKPTGLAGEAMLRAETPQEQFNLIGAGRRNLIINGNFIVSQRGNYTSSSSPSDGDFTVDRWQVIQDGSPSTALIQNTDGSMKLTAGAATTGSMRFRQKFEYNLFPRQYDNKTFILSAKIKSNSQNARLNVYAGGYIAISGVTSHSGSGQYETLTAIFTTPATIATEFSVHIGIDGVNSANTAISTGEYFEVKEVQLELGKVATPFEHRSYGEELALCLRYFWRVTKETTYHNVTNVAAYSANNVYGTLYFPVQMRAIPSFEHSGASDFFVTGDNDNLTPTTLSADEMSKWNAQILVGETSGFTQGYAYWFRFDSDTPSGQYFQFDAEL
jgi:hypothetical protein